MRIIFLTQWFDPEPGAIRGLPLAAWLRTRGHEVKVITAFPNYPGGKIYPGYRMRWREWQDRDGVRILRLPLYPSHDTSALGRALNYLSFMLSSTILGTVLIGPADVVYVYHPPPTVGLAALWLKYIRRIPFVYHIADMWPESVVESGMVGQGVIKKWIEGAIHWWCNRLYAAAHTVTVLSPGFKDLLSARGVDPAKVEVVYNWTDEAFRPLPRDNQLGQELGLQGKFNVIYAGNLGMFQGLHTVLKAARRLQNQPEIQIVFAGGGQKEHELRAAAKDLRNVIFLKGRPVMEMPAINSLADVLLVHLKDLAFFSSTIPSKTQVSLASGRPILMAVRGDAADIVEQARAGLTCPPEDEMTMADKILDLYRMNPCEREEMGLRGRQFYIDKMSLNVGGAAMEEIFLRAGQPSLVASVSTAQGD